jgi:Escherichia/Staphylococcus phage prohead protease
MSKHKHEIRSFTAARPFEVRTLANGQKQVSGYAIVWNSRSVDLGGFTEICSPKMLNRTLKENPDVLMLRDHKQELLLGRTSAGTLSLNVDNVGLAFTVTLPQTAIGDDTYENVKLRNLSGCSFGFTTMDDSFDYDADGNVVRTLLDIDLIECSITSFPAYQKSSVFTRSRAARAASMRSMKTKSVDGVELPPSSFAFVGDESDPSTWHLPIHFPGDDEKTKSHIKDALARFDQTDGIPDSEKQEVYGRIVGAAKAHGIMVAKESYRDEDELDNDLGDDNEDFDADDADDADCDDYDDDDDCEDDRRRDVLRVRTLFTHRMTNF